MKTGLLLVNLGTPDAPRPAETRRYLAEFLSDPRVLDIPAAGRWALLHLVILRTRPMQSAEAYAKVWTEAGSPLLVHSRALEEALRAELPELDVELAMRYGKPSIPEGLTALRERGCASVVVFPLYPQYASSSTGTALEAVYREAAVHWNTPHLSVVPPFYDEPGFLDAWAELARPELASFEPDHVLFSYHGLPERHVQKSDSTGRWCLATDDCCAELVEANRWCYRAQCYATTRGLVERLGLAADGHSVSFQSRLGRTPWIRPYTDLVLPELAERGVRRVAVFCPAFVADCLETLEEIGLRAREDFRAAGGEDLHLVPSLNAHPAWVRAAADLARRAVPGAAARA